MLIFKHGDLLNSSAQTLVNTVNCVGVMGKGIALRFRKAYPEMFLDYMSRCRDHELKLGEPYMYRTASKQIINFPTKNHWRGCSDLKSIRIGLERIREQWEEWGVLSLAIPPLGCGNGGLDWSDVRPLIVEVLTPVDIDIQVYEPSPFELRPPSLEVAASAERAAVPPCQAGDVQPEQLYLF